MHAKHYEKLIAEAMEQLIAHANLNNPDNPKRLPEAACCIYELLTRKFVRTFGETWIGHAITGPGGDMGKYRFFIKELCEKDGIYDKYRFDYAELKLLDEITLFSDLSLDNLVVIKTTHEPSELCLLAIKHFRQHNNQCPIAIVWPSGKIVYAVDISLSEQIAALDLEY